MMDSLLHIVSYPLGFYECFSVFDRDGCGREYMYNMSEKYTSNRYLYIVHIRSVI